MGESDGDDDGLVGRTEGKIVGIFDGTNVGGKVGFELGTVVGNNEGFDDGE